VLYLTRRFAFSSSHRLHSNALSGAENACSYGICENIHGHNYRLEVTVAGDVDAKTGFFCNVMELHALVHQLVVQPCDHHYLNEVTLFSGGITTMEGLSGCIWRVLEPELRQKGMRLHEILLAETDEHWVRLRQD
jgi:6-pyruvoyltetrahydropterin/6-carboxytetrahydropterin synthase